MRAQALLLSAVACVGLLTCRGADPLYRLGYAVVDAAYSRSLGHLVMVATEPPSLHLYDPFRRVDRSIDLPADPTSLALDPEGRFAAVGHDGLVSYLDLLEGTVVATYSAPASVRSVLVADNGRIYAFPITTSSSGAILEIEVASGTVTAGYNDWGWGTLRQRPGTPCVYGVPNQHLRRFDISSGAMLPAFSAPDPPYWYPEDHPYCGALWLSEEGRRIFTSCGHTFRASSSVDQDMRYIGSLAGVEGVRGVSDSSAAGHVLVIPYDWRDQLADTRLQLYHRSYLKYRGSLELPRFLEGGEEFPAHGRWVFFDESGRNFFSIVQADSAAGLANDFAVYTSAFAPRFFGGASGPVPPPAPTEMFRLLDHVVVDAEYAEMLDRIIYVSSDPNALHIFDPETGADDPVLLPFPPNSVSIGPGQDRAAVGHEAGSVSLIDLESATLLVNHPTTRAVLDSVLAQEWVYLFERYGSAPIREIELATGMLEKNIWFVASGGWRAKLDATGTKLYLASNYQYPTSLKRIDVSQHPSAYVYTRQPSGVDICGDIWLSEEGDRLFTRCGGVLHSSTDPAIDVTVEGLLGGEGSLIRHLSDSQEAGVIAAIPGIPDDFAYGLGHIPGSNWDGDIWADTRVKLFDSSDLSLGGSLALPDFVLGAESHPARGRFAFFNRSGTRLHVIVEADMASGLVDGFGLVSLDLE